MRNSKLWLVVGIGLCAISAQGNNLVVNGNFGTGDLTDWSVDHGNVSVVSQGGGSYAADFQAQTYNNVYLYESSLAQNGLNLTVGDEYTLSYTVSGTGNEAWYASVGYQTNSQWWNGSPTDQSYGYGVPFTGLKTFSETFTYLAGGNFLYFSFNDLNSNHESMQGAAGYLSNVSITPVPEPFTTTLGVAAVGLAVRRKFSQRN